MVRKLLIISLLILAITPKSVFAAFEMSIEDGFRTIDFGAMKLDEEVTLARRGGYEHQFNFTSDNGRTWYFKAQLVRPFTSGRHSIPAENLKWIVEEKIGGAGLIEANISRPNDFSDFPVLIYTSSDTDNTGTEVRIRLKYRLKIPKNQAAGTYNAHIRFIMVEGL